VFIGLVSGPGGAAAPTALLAGLAVLCVAVGAGLAWRDAIGVRARQADALAALATQAELFGRLVEEGALSRAGLAAQMMVRARQADALVVLAQQVSEMLGVPVEKSAPSRAGPDVRRRVVYDEEVSAGLGTPKQRRLRVELIQQAVDRLGAEVGAGAMQPGLRLGAGQHSGDVRVLDIAAGDVVFAVRSSARFYLLVRGRPDEDWRTFTVTDVKELTGEQARQDGIA
jgi:F0F1-type ATP synthase membrane subunit c/vacuolar-type H+-ATPase subunit K